MFNRIRGKRTDKYKAEKLNALSCSNAIYFATTPFCELPTNVKEILGIKKVS